MLSLEQALPGEDGIFSDVPRMCAHTILKGPPAGSRSNCRWHMICDYGGWLCVVCRTRHAQYGEDRIRGSSCCQLSCHVKRMLADFDRIPTRRIPAADLNFRMPRHRHSAGAEIFLRLSVPSAVLLSGPNKVQLHTRKRQ